MKLNMYIDPNVDMKLRAFVYTYLWGELPREYQNLFVNSREFTMYAPLYNFKVPQ